MLHENYVLYALEKTLQLSTDPDPEPDYEENVVNTVFQIIGLLSALGCLFNLLITLILKLHRNVLGKMMIFLSLNDLFYTITLGAPGLGLDGDSLFVHTVNGLSWAGSVSWVCCFAHALYTSVKFNGDCVDNSLLKKYIITTTVLSIVTGCVFAINVILRPGVDLTVLVFTYLGTMAILSILFCGFCYVSVLNKLRRYEEQLHLELLLYPLFLILCEFPSVLIQVYVTLFDTKLPETLFGISILFLISRGIWDSLAYGLSSKIRDGIKTLCRKKHQEAHEEELVKPYNSSLPYTRYTEQSRDSADLPTFVVN
mgnify:FL=1